jgi:glycine/D-amino acid oxidase-like deaminating enzyme
MGSAPTGLKPVRVCVIGGGVAGLSAATYLSDHDGFRVTMLERDAQLGGRANVIGGAEHCQRLFISNYDRMFSLLDRIPVNGGTVLSSLEPVTRMVYFDSQWKAIDHLYAIWSRELAFFEKYRVISARRRSALLADRGTARMTALRIARNFRLRDVATVLVATKRANRLWCLPGVTDLTLTMPWTKHVREHGVEVMTAEEVLSVERIGDDRKWMVRTANQSWVFDAVLFTMLPHDLAPILSRSGLDHRVPRRQENLHFPVLTFDYSPSGRAMRELEPYSLLAHNGMTVFIQRPAGRAVAFCTNPMNAPLALVEDRSRQICNEFGQLSLVGSRVNDLPGEAIYSSRLTHPDKVLKRPAAGLYFAGSGIHSGYPGDSGEAAVRSAELAVAQLVADFRLTGMSSLRRHGSGRDSRLQEVEGQ